MIGGRGTVAGRVISEQNLNTVFSLDYLTELCRRLGGDRLFQRASSWSKCCDWARAACSGPRFVCDVMVFISAIFEISSMLAETENLRLSLSSTCAIITDDVRWPYFFCQVYVSSETSFLRSRRIWRLGPAGRRSVRKLVFFCHIIRNVPNMSHLQHPWPVPNTSAI